MSLRRLLRCILLGLCFGLLELFFFLSPWGQEIEFRLLDTWFRTRGELASPKDVAIVALDEESYRNSGVPLNAPWPRELHARLLDRLAKAGAKRVIFDVLFLGPSEPAQDAALARALSQLPTVIGAELGTVTDSTYAQQSLLMPYELFRAQSEIGLVGLKLTNGVTRFFPQADSTFGETILPLAVAAVQEKGLPIELPPAGALINFHGPARTIKTYSYYQLLDPEANFPDQEVQGKIIFVGLSLRTGTGADKKDAYLTSFRSLGLTYGVEVQATAAANLLRHSWLERPSLEKRMYFVTASCALLAGIIFYLTPLWGAILLSSAAAVWLITGYQLFLHHLVIPAAGPILIALPVAFLLSTLFYYAKTKREQRKLMQAFQLYLSPEMAREVALNRESVKLGGALVEATALFTDIQGFTHISESMPPAETASMLNAYFTEVMEAIFEKQGTLIKFIGDAVFALWGAPLRISGHAQKCYDAALAIMHDVSRFNSSRRYPALHTRIGINTGPMLVGNLGAARRFDFTAIGDAVNLASRVEGLNKYLGTALLMTENTLAQLTNAVGLIPFGKFKVSGKDIPIALFGRFITEPAGDDSLAFQRAVSLFQQGQLDESKNIFNALQGSNGAFTLAAKLYTDFIAVLPRSDIANGWDGAVRLDTK